MKRGKGSADTDYDLGMQLGNSVLDVQRRIGATNEQMADVLRLIARKLTEQATKDPG